MASRQDWLDEGLRLLGEEGEPGLRIDRLAARLNLSKGSFFHHFAGIADYRAALLANWEAQAMRGLSDAPPRELLSSLAARVGDLVDLRLEAAVRAWAFHDPAAAAAQERVDRARLAGLEKIWSHLVDDPARAHAAALIPHLVVIGAGVALPPTSPDELDGVFALLAELVPAVSPPVPAAHPTASPPVSAALPTASPPVSAAHPTA